MKQNVKTFFIALLLLMTCDRALAQWQVPEFGTPNGRGPGKQGFNSIIPGAAGTVFTSNGLSALPSFQIPPAYGVISIAAYTPGNTSNDTVGVQAALTACGVASGCSLVCVPGVTYTIDTVNFSSNTYLNGTGCIFKQRADGLSSSSSTFSINGKINITLINVSMLGTATPGGNNPFGASGNSAIYIRGLSSNIRVLNSFITEFKYFPVQLENSSGLFVTGNYFYENWAGPRLTGVHNVELSHNIIDRTTVYSLTPTNDQFTAGIALDSTDGHAFGICTDIMMVGNRISNFPWAQAFLIHAGQRVTISANVIFNTSVGVSITPYNTLDVVEKVAVTGNDFDPTLISHANFPLIEIANAAVQVTGGPASGGGTTPSPTRVSVVGNTANGWNRAAMDPGQGCMYFTFTTGLILSGNTVSGCGGNGYYFGTDEQGAAVTGNTATNSTLIGALQTGFNWAGAPRAVMMGNMVSGMNSGTGVGYNVVTVTNLKWKDGGGVLLNGSFDNTTANVP